MQALQCLLMFVLRRYRLKITILIGSKQGISIGRIGFVASHVGSNIVGVQQLHGTPALALQPFSHVDRGQTTFTDEPEQLPLTVENGANSVAGLWRNHGPDSSDASWAASTGRAP